MHDLEKTLTDKEAHYKYKILRRLTDKLKSVDHHEMLDFNENLNLSKMSSMNYDRADSNNHSYNHNHNYNGNDINRNVDCNLD